MAAQGALAAVKRARQPAVVTLEVLAAGAAQQQRRVAASVAQQDDLVAGGERSLDLLAQSLAELDLAGALTDALGAQVDQHALGHRRVADPTAKLEGGQLAELDVVSTLEAGRRRDQDGDGAIALGAQEGQVAALIAGGGVLLVGAVVLLVDHDEAELGERREKRRARAQDDPRRARAEPFPLLVTLVRGEAGMENRHLVAVALAHGGGERRDQGDLGHQEDHAATLSETVVSGSEIDLGLARAGDALDEKALVGAPIERGLERPQGIGLIRAQIEGGRRFGAGAMGVEVEALDLSELAQDVELDQAAHDPRATVDLSLDLASGGRPAQGVEQLDHRPALIRSPAALEQFIEGAGRQLDRCRVAHAPLATLRHREAAPLAQPLDDPMQIVQRGRGLQLGESQSPPFGQRRQHPAFLVVAAGGQGARVGQPDPLVPPGGQLAGNHAPQYLADGCHVVVGDEGGQVEQFLGQQREAVDDRIQRSNSHPVRRNVGEPGDDTDQPARSDPHAGARSGPRQADEGLRHLVDQRGVERQRYGDLGVDLG